MEWQEYVDLDKSDDNSNEGIFCIPRRPGEIDNSNLLLNESVVEGNELDLKRSLQEGEDYSLVPQDAWKKLLEWYIWLFLFVFVESVLSTVIWETFIFLENHHQISFDCVS